MVDPWLFATVRILLKRVHVLESGLQSEKTQLRLAELISCPSYDPTELDVVDLTADDLLNADAKNHALDVLPVDSIDVVNVTADDLSNADANHAPDILPVDSMTEAKKSRRKKKGVSFSDSEDMSNKVAEQHDFENDFKDVPKNDSENDFEDVLSEQVPKNDLENDFEDMRDLENDFEDVRVRQHDKYLATVRDMQAAIEAIRGAIKALKNFKGNLKGDADADVLQVKALAGQALKDIVMRNAVDELRAKAGAITTAALADVMLDYGKDDFYEKYKMRLLVHGASENIHPSLLGDWAEGCADNSKKMVSNFESEECGD